MSYQIGHIVGSFAAPIVIILGPPSLGFGCKSNDLTLLSDQKIYFHTWFIDIRLFAPVLEPFAHSQISHVQAKFVKRCLYIFGNLPLSGWMNGSQHLLRLGSAILTVHTVTGSWNIWKLCWDVHTYKTPSSVQLETILYILLSWNNKLCTKP